MVREIKKKNSLKNGRAESERKDLSITYRQSVCGIHLSTQYSLLRIHN
jgi:hypothetical protein